MVVEKWAIGISFRGFKWIGLWGLDLSLDRCFPSVFGIVAKFWRRKSDSILPCFSGGNPAALRLKCIITHNTLFSPSFFCENMAIGMPHFHGENLAKFRIWCTIAHRQGFMPVYTTCAYMLMLRWPGAPQSIKHIDTCRIHGETDVTWWHGLVRSHRGDYDTVWHEYAPTTNALSTYSCHKGQEHSWLEKVAYVAICVHDHPHTCRHIYIHASCTMLSHGAGK